MKSIIRGSLCALLLRILACVAVVGSSAKADTFGSGANSFDIQFVPIGNPGNSADTKANHGPVGAVPYSYRIGKYEISEQMIDNANALGGLAITKDTRGPDKPATSVTWYEAATFVNWLDTSTGSVPAYKFVGGNFELWQPGDPGYDPANLFRNSLAKYILPSADEWYKAAYYDPVANSYWKYPTGSNAPPQAVQSGVAPGTAVFGLDILADGPADIMQAGGLSPYGTMAQGGNVEEWEETALDVPNNDPSAVRTVRGASWDALSFDLSTSAFAGRYPSIPLKVSGLRVSSVVPEPSAVLLFGIGIAGAVALAWRELARNVSKT